MVSARPHIISYETNLIFGIKIKHIQFNFYIINLSQGGKATYMVRSHELMLNECTPCLLPGN